MIFGKYHAMIDSLARITLRGEPIEFVTSPAATSAAPKICRLKNKGHRGTGKSGSLNLVLLTTKLKLKLKNLFFKKEKR